MKLPEHVEATITMTYRCGRCGGRLILGAYEKPDKAALVLTEWLERHQHDDQEPTP